MTNAPANNFANEFSVDPSAAADVEATSRAELRDLVTGDLIVDENGDPAYIEVFSAQSETFRRRVFRVQGKWQTLRKARRDRPLSFDEEQRAEAEVYAAAFGGSWNIVKKTPDGWRRIDAPLTPENAMKWVLANPLYKPQISLVTDTLDAFLRPGDGNFTPSA